ncbi:MAG: hypothetical protein GY759_17330 [Chloroflexi bacterium]|nr:hypothetical protein [Chloroflexota bacterium]
MTSSQNNSSSRTILIIGAIALVVLACCCLFLMTAAGFFLITNVGYIETSINESLPATVEPVRPTPLPRPTPTPRESYEGSSQNLDTETLLREALVPSNDPRDLAMRLKPELGDIPLVVNDTPPHFEVGDVISFWVGNGDNDENWQIDAELLVKSDHLYMWGEVGTKLNTDDLRRSAEFFDTEIYPTNRAFFGSEWSPGIDNDPRLHVLHATGIGDTVAGYFSTADEASSLINPFSNEKEMFYINVDNTDIGSTFYNGVLAHEFQHMIHWNQDLNESTWMDEGAAELAMQLNGLGRSDDSYRPEDLFADDPDVQLNSWPDSDDTYVHYGVSFLFLNYFLGRFGEEVTQALIAEPANSVEALDNVLQQFNLGLSVDELFADWLVANWLDDPSLADGRWGYTLYDPADWTTSEHHRRLPAEGSGVVHQYAADYITVDAKGDVNITFSGQPTNKLAATDAYSGDWAFWSNRVNVSDTRLTMPVDLSDIDTATLRYQTWYDIEELWDYAYVEVSTDGGDTWTMLETNRTTEDNPNGTGYGIGYTGQSGQESAEWVQEEVDLSDYAGQPILIRFEYVTDTAVTQPGMFIDDVEIPELGYLEDFEQGPGDWQSEGWLLTNNLLQQRWVVQVIEAKADGSVVIHQVPVGADGQGSLRLTGVDNREDLVLVISALAPVTVETAEYQYSLSQER